MSTFDPSTPFTAEQAARAGITAGALRGPHYVTLFRGVYVDARTAPTLGVRAIAALALHPPTAYLSHMTSAELQRVPVPLSADVHLTVLKRGQRRSRSGLVAHVCQEGVSEVIGGLRMSTGPHLFRELAQRLSPVDLVAAGDDMVRRNLVGLHHLVWFLDQSHQSGVVPGRRAVHLINPRAESAPESHTRVLLRLAGFPEPLVNQTIRDGTVVYRPDLCWPWLKLIVEYDGRHHLLDPGQWERDLRRREWFERNGWTVIVVTARDIYRQPADTLARVHDAWLRRGGPDFTVTSDWQRHFRTHRAA